MVAVGNISLHLSNETKNREKAHEKEGKEKILGNKIKVLQLQKCPAAKKKPR